jgi:hypothetical protein
VRCKKCRSGRFGGGLFEELYQIVSPVRFADKFAYFTSPECGQHRLQAVCRAEDDFDIRADPAEFVKQLRTGNSRQRNVENDDSDIQCIKEFFKFNQALGWQSAGTLNLNIRYGRMTMALARCAPFSAAYRPMTLRV